MEAAPLAPAAFVPVAEGDGVEAPLPVPTAAPVEPAAAPVDPAAAVPEAAEALEPVVLPLAGEPFTALEAAAAVLKAS